MEHSFFDPELGALAEIAEALEAVMVGTYTVTTACTWTGMYNGAELNLSFSVGTLTPTAQQQYALDNFIVPASYATNPNGQTGPAATPVTPAPPVTAGWTLQANGTGGTTFAAPGASSALNLPRVINITDSTWGFVGDGATDNGSKWTALNTALAGYSGTQQVIVYAPAGTYMSSVTPKLPSTSELYGDGVASVLMAVANTVINVVGFVANFTHVRIHDIVIDGNSANSMFPNPVQYTAFSGVCAPAGSGTCADLIVDHCVIRNCWESGVLIGDCNISRVLIESNHFVNNFDNQVFARPGCDNVKVRGNHFGPNRTGPITFTSSNATMTISGQAGSGPTTRRRSPLAAGARAPRMPSGPASRATSTPRWWSPAPPHRVGRSRLAQPPSPS